MRDDWRLVRLGDIAYVNPEVVPKWPHGHRIRYVDIASVSEESGIQLDAVSNMEFGASPGRARRLIRGGDVLVSTVRPNLRGFARVPDDLDGEVASTGFAVIRAREDVLPGFLWTLVRSERFVAELVARCTGSNYPAVRADDVEAFTFALPPLEVQRRIVEVCESLDLAIEATESENQALEALTIRVAVDWRWRGPLATSRLGDVADLYQPKTLAKSELVQSGPYPVYGANGFIGFHDEYNHEAPQLAVTCRGATCGTINWTPSKCWITGNAMVVRSADESLLTRYLYWALKFRVDLSGTITGSAQPQITRTSLSPLYVEVPPLPEQESFVATLDALAARLEFGKETSATLRSLRAVIITGLTQGDFEIPEAYEELLGEAV